MSRQQEQPRYLRDMSVMEEQWSKAWHELTCDEEPPGHPLAEHEPFDVEEDDWTWQQFVETLRKYGVRIEVGAPSPDPDAA